MGSDPRELRLWKTQQVARALGLSVSTVKRLVDSGEIRAARTSGKHRLIEPAEARRYALERDLPFATPETPDPGRHEEDVEALGQALRRGRSEESRALILAAYRAGGSAAALADRWIGPVMAVIGHEWESGGVDVYQEHRATRIVEASLIDLIGRVRGGRRGDPRTQPALPLAIGAGPEGDPYTVAGLLCELALLEQGWDVMNLGPNLPMASLAKAVLAHQPRLVWITASHLSDPGRFAREYASFRAAASKAGAAVVLGGRAIGPELAADGVGGRVSDLADFARGLLARGPSHQGPTPRSGLESERLATGQDPTSEPS